MNKYISFIPRSRVRGQRRRKQEIPLTSNPHVQNFRHRPSSLVGKWIYDWEDGIF